jgi:ABC-type uncharacterized transport system permease subunit
VLKGFVKVYRLASQCPLYRTLIDLDFCLRVVVSEAWQLAHLLPYSIFVALFLVARKASYPKALMKPYRKGER